MNGRLDGKVAIITGSGGAIGAACSRAFAAEGAKVVGCDLAPETARAAARIVRDAGGAIISIEPVDLSRRVECDRVVTYALQEFGRVDVLCEQCGTPPLRLDG